MTMAGGAPIVRFAGVTKRFPGVTALAGVSLDIARGECHALCGENGAGKSTLGKVLVGIEQPDEGWVEIDGRRVRFRSPADARSAGIGMVHQELAFCENLTVAENLCLGDLPSRAWLLSRAALAARARAQLEEIDGGHIDVGHTVGELPVGQQQLVQIAAAIGQGARIIVLDEPTSSLTQHEAERLYRLVARLKAAGVTIVYVSHRLEEIFRLCDTVSVLRDGRLVATRAARDLDEDALVQLMVGRAVDQDGTAIDASAAGSELLRVEELTSPGKLEGVSFAVRAGEILGMAGLVGAGRTEAAQAVFGLDPAARGRIFMEGRPVRIGRPADAMRLGLGLVPEDRKRHGLVLGMSARANVTLPTLGAATRGGFIHRRAEHALAAGEIARLRLPLARLDAPVAGLSGGNQQKVVFARWLAARCRVLMLDEPTRGVDVAAKAEIHALVRSLAQDGRGVLLISSELPELIRVATRIIVMRGGRIVGELPRASASADGILRLMTGVGEMFTRSSSAGGMDLWS
jgi:ABC-type sugar transport system ATPase subunit